jgi:hypothetical protein
MKTKFKCGLLEIVLVASSSITALAGGVVSTCDEASLRAALAGGGTVTFACDGTITLANTLAITNGTVIDASGHGITISGGNAVRLLTVDPGVNLSLIQLTLANGRHKGADGVLGPPITDGQPGMGGAILNNGGTVALTGCTVVSNVAVGGAGYLNCIWPTNSAGGVALGGAICNLTGSLAVTNCSFMANESIGGTGGRNSNYGAIGGDACGGAIYSPGGSVTVQSSTFISQAVRGGLPGQGTAVVSYQAGSGLGGAIWVSNATANFYNGTFTGDIAVGADQLAYTVAGSAGSGMGGAIFATNGAVNCAGCTFTGNNAAAGYNLKGGAGLAQGGAIWSHAALSVSQSGFIGNQAIGKGNGSIGVPAGEGSGGAIFSTNTLSLSDSTFAYNEAQGGYGGVRSSYNCPGGLGRGGAVCSLGTLTATNCTVAANSALGGAGGNGVNTYNPAGGDGLGGGLFNTNGTTTLMNLTFASNNATGGAGGFWAGGPPGPAGASSGGAVCNSGGTVTLLNTILAYSTSGSNCYGTLTDLGHNLSSDSTPVFTCPCSVNNTDPVLGPLANYGGPTLTMALLAGSPAIDGGDPASYPPADQRGHARPFGSAPDIGAFESSPPYTVLGTISGFTFVEEAAVTAGSSATNTFNHGFYNLGGLSAGTWSVTPQSPSYLFLPGNRSVTVGPDQIGVNFKAYLWNAMSLEGVTNSSIHVIVPGTNGVSYRLLSSGDLRQWTPMATNVMGPSSYWEMFLPVSGAGQQFFRTVTP